MVVALIVTSVLIVLVVIIARLSKAKFIDTLDPYVFCRDAVHIARKANSACERTVF